MFRHTLSHCVILRNSRLRQSQVKLLYRLLQAREEVGSLPLRRNWMKRPQQNRQSDSDKHYKEFIVCV